MEKTVIGIAGLGWWGPKLLRNVLNHPNVEKVYGYDLSFEAIDAARRSGLDFIPVNEYSELLNLTSSIIIATPPNSHFELAKKAMNSGKNVLVTKPPCETLNEVNILSKLAQKNDLVYMTDATYIFNPVIDTIYADLKKRLSQLKSVRILRFGDDLRLHHISRIENTMSANGIDVINDLIFHDISILRYLLGADVQIDAINKLYNLNPNFADSAYILMRFNGIPVVIEYSWTFPERKREFQFYFQDSFLIWDDLSKQDKIWKYTFKNKQKEVIGTEEIEPLYCVIDHFISCIEKKCEPKTGINFMKDVMDIMGKINNHGEKLI